MLIQKILSGWITNLSTHPRSLSPPGEREGEAKKFSLITSTSTSLFEEEECLPAVLHLLAGGGVALNPGFLAETILNRKHLFNISPCTPYNTSILRMKVPFDTSPW